jgi:hypothetical protein
MSAREKPAAANNRPVYIPSRKRKKEEERVNRRVGAYFRFDDVVTPPVSAFSSSDNFMDAQDYNEWGGVAVPHRGRALLRHLGLRRTADGGTWIRTCNNDNAVERIPSTMPPVMPEGIRRTLRAGVGYTAGALRADSQRSAAGWDAVYDDDAGGESLWSRIHAPPSQSGPLSVRRAVLPFAYEPPLDSDEEEDGGVVAPAWTQLSTTTTTDRSDASPLLPGFVRGAPCVQRYCPGPELPVDWDLPRIRPTTFSPPIVGARPPPSIGPFSGAVGSPAMPPRPRIVPLPRPPIVPLPTTMAARFAVASDATREERVEPTPGEDAAWQYSRVSHPWAPESLLRQRLCGRPTR